MPQGRHPVAIRDFLVPKAERQQKAKEGGAHGELTEPPTGK